MSASGGAGEHAACSATTPSLPPSDRIGASRRRRALDVHPSPVHELAGEVPLMTLDHLGLRFGRPIDAQPRTEPIGGIPELV
jgi:hypothetical protein